MGKNVIISTLPNISQNYLPKVNTSNIFANSLVYDDGNSVLINTTTASAFRLDVNGTGRFQGALTGTSATFTLANDITLTARSGAAGSYTYWSLGRTSSELELGVAAAANQFFTGTAAGDVIIKANGSSNKLMFGYGSGSPTLTLASTGAATFSSSVTANGSAYFGTFNGSNKYYFEPFSNLAGGANNAYLVSGKADNNERSGFVFQARNSNGEEYNVVAFEGYNSTATSTAFAIGSTGAATFSSSVTAGNLGFIATNAYGFVSYSAATATGANISFGSSVYNTFDGIYQSSGSTRDFGIWLNGGTINDPKFVIKNGGNVGIGTNDPKGVLHAYLGSITTGNAPASSGTTPVNAMLNLTNNRGVGMYFGGSYSGTYAQWIQVADTGNLGVYYPLSLNPNGGNVGIGTTSPDTYSYGGTRKFLTFRATLTNEEPFLQLIANGTGNSLIDFGNATIRRATIIGLDGSILSFYTNGSNSGTSVTERMRITSGGDVWINQQTLYVNSAKLISYQGYNSDSNTTTLSTQRTSGFFEISAGDNSNNQGSYCAIVARASVGASNNPGSLFRGYSTTTLSIQINHNGNITNTNNSYGALSDISLKENITDATPKLADLLRVKVRNYNLVGSSTKQIGVIAQELDEVFPSMIEKNSEGIKGVKYSVFVPMLIKAIQELKGENDTLKADIESLKALINK